MINPTSSTEPKSLLSWVSGIAGALEMRGIESRPLFEKAGVPYNAMPDPIHRIETSKVTRLLQLAVEATGDPSFGLKTVVYMHPASLNAVGFALYASSTLHDFFQRLIRFFRLLSDNATNHLALDKDAWRFTIEVINPNLGYENVDAYVGLIVFLCRHICRPDFAPLRVELRRPKPATHADEYSRFFKAPVTFSAKKDVLYFDKDDMLVLLPAANTELARRNDEMAMELLSRQDRNDIVRQVEAKIVQLLPTGECTKDKIASLLNISPRILRNKLEQENTSYQTLLDSLRSGLARQYVEQHNMTICEITYLLGFSDTSNFSRAFRRWTGLSPSQFRSQTSEHRKAP